MKKAKIIFISVALTAAIGGVLALKIHRNHTLVFKTTTTTRTTSSGAIVTITICKLLADFYDFDANAPLVTSVYTTPATNTTTIPTTFCSLNIRLRKED